MKNTSLWRLWCTDNRMGGDNDNILIIHYIDCIVPIPTFKIIFPELYTVKGREIHPMVLHINLLPYKTNMFVCYLCIRFSLEIIIMNIIIQGTYTLWVCKFHIIIPPWYTWTSFRKSALLHFLIDHTENATYVLFRFCI